MARLPKDLSANTWRPLLYVVVAFMALPIAAHDDAWPHIASAVPFLLQYEDAPSILRRVAFVAFLSFPLVMMRRLSHERRVNDRYEKTLASLCSGPMAYPEQLSPLTPLERLSSDIRKSLGEPLVQAIVRAQEAGVSPSDLRPFSDAWIRIKESEGHLDLMLTIVPAVAAVLTPFSLPASACMLTLMLPLSAVASVRRRATRGAIIEELDRVVGEHRHDQK